MLKHHYSSFTSFINIGINFSPFSAWSYSYCKSVIRVVCILSLMKFLWFFCSYNFLNLISFYFVLWNCTYKLMSKAANFQSACPFKNHCGSLSIPREFFIHVSYKRVESVSETHTCFFEHVKGWLVQRATSDDLILTEWHEWTSANSNRDENTFELGLMEI